MAALFKQLLNFRIFLFLKFFAKSINKLTKGNYVIWVTIVKTKPITEITRFDGMIHHQVVGLSDTRDVRRIYYCNQACKMHPARVKYTFEHFLNISMIIPQTFKLSLRSNNGTRRSYSMQKTT